MREVLDDRVEFPAVFLRELHGADPCGYEHESRQHIALEISEHVLRLEPELGGEKPGDRGRGVMTYHEFAAAFEDRLAAPILVDAVGVIRRRAQVEIRVRAVV